MKGKSIKLLLISGACILLLVTTVLIAMGSGTKLLPPPEESTPTSTTRKIPTTTKANDGRTSAFFYRTKNRGSCRSLTKKVHLVFYLVSDGDTVWTEEDINTFKKATDDALYSLRFDASMYRAELDVACSFVPISYEKPIIREEAINGKALYEMMDAIGLEDRETLSSRLCTEYGTDSAALLLCFNRSERSFAINTTEEDEFEFAVLYGNDEDFRHELFHLYGARDLYKPDRINEISGRFFYDSIMRTSGGVIVDPLTAYLIGWTDTLNGSAQEFLDAVDQKTN